jgi:hypothetical protein
VVDFGGEADRWWLEWIVGWQFEAKGEGAALSDISLLRPMIRG